MNRKTITVQTNVKKKGKLDQRSFTCQVIELGESRVYILDKTKNDLTRKRFQLTPGCRLTDEGITYNIENIEYWKKPMYPFLIIQGGKPEWKRRSSQSKPTL